jgi:hypothetical protein
MAHNYAAVSDEMAPKTSSPSPQPPPSSLNIMTKFFTKAWTFEVVSTLVGTVLTVVLCVLVSSYNGEPVPSFGSVLNTDITLNFVVSLILSIAIPALMLPVASSVAQLKWIWFSRGSRPLDHLEIFDEASRGTIGSMAFLWKMRAR